MPLPPKRIANLIYFLGGRTMFHATAKRLGYRLSMNTIHSWITRNSLPAKHVDVCNSVAAANGTPVNWTKVFS